MTIAAAQAAMTAGNAAALLPKSDGTASGSIFDALLATESQSAMPETSVPADAAMTAIPPMPATAAPGAMPMSPPPAGSFPWPLPQMPSLESETAAAPSAPPVQVAAPAANAAPPDSAKAATAAPPAPTPIPPAAVPAEAATLPLQTVTAKPSQALPVAQTDARTPPAEEPGDNAAVAAQAQTNPAPIAPQTKQAVRAVPHGAVEDAKPEDKAAPADDRADAPMPAPVIAIAQPVPTASVMPAIPQASADPLLAVALQSGAVRPGSANSAKPEAPQPAVADDTSEAEASAAPSSPPTATPSKPQAVAGKPALPVALAADKRSQNSDSTTAADTAPKAEAPDPAAPKPAAELKHAETSNAPQAAPGESAASPASAPQPAPAANPTPTFGALAAAPAHRANDAPDSDAPVQLALRNVAGLPDAADGMAALGVRIAAKSASGDSHFQIRLDPPELGRIDVHLKLDGDGNAEAALSADKQQTLDLLQRDSRMLERALKDAGLALPAGLSFSLKGEGQNRAGRDGQSGGRSRNFEIGAIDGAAKPHLAAAAYAYGAGQQRLDIVV